MLKKIALIVWQVLLDQVAIFTREESYQLVEVETRSQKNNVETFNFIMNTMFSAIFIMFVLRVLTLIMFNK